MLENGVKNVDFPKKIACRKHPPAKFLASGDCHGHVGLDRYTTPPPPPPPPQDFLAGSTPDMEYMFKVHRI